MIRLLFNAWRDGMRERADDIRSSWADYQAQWERDTEPGYSMGTAMTFRRDVGLAIADLLDALTGREAAKKDLR